MLTIPSDYGSTMCTTIIYCCSRSIALGMHAALYATLSPRTIKQLLVPVSINMRGARGSFEPLLRTSYSTILHRKRVSTLWRLPRRDTRPYLLYLQVWCCLVLGTLVKSAVLATRGGERPGARQEPPESRLQRYSMYNVYNNVQLLCQNKCCIQNNLGSQ